MERQPISQENKLPDFKENWMKIKYQLPKFFPPSDWESVLDSITVGWRDLGEKIPDRLKTFSDSLALPNIPKMEVSEASLKYTEVKNEWDKFAEGIFGITNGVKYKWPQMLQLSYQAETLGYLKCSNIFQASALLQAISETHKEGRTPEVIRQRVAQHAFDELIRISTYSFYEHKGGGPVTTRTTQDDPETEKNELVNALSSDLWDKNTIEKRMKDYKKLREIILKGYNSVDGDVADQLERLWNATKGEGVTRNSALHFLKLTQEIYINLEHGGAFDVE